MENRRILEKHQFRADRLKREIPTDLDYQVGDLAYYPYWETGEVEAPIKGRPVLIIGKSGGHALVAEITSHAPRPQFNGEVALNQYEQFGLSKSGTLRLTQQADVLIKDFVFKIGALDEDTLKFVFEKLQQLSGNEIKLRRYRNNKASKKLSIKENLQEKEVTSEDINDFIEDIYDLRKDSMEKEGEYGLGNLVFKEMRNLGYLDYLKELKNELKSEELSLENLNK